MTCKLHDAMIEALLTDDCTLRPCEILKELEAINPSSPDHYQAVKRDVARKVRKFKAFHTTSNLKSLGINVGGAPRLIHRLAEDFVIEILAESPTMWRDEICDALLNEFDIDVSPWTVGRMLRREGLTHKVSTSTSTLYGLMTPLSNLSNRLLSVLQASETLF